MTPKELYQRLQAHLEALVWEGTSNKVFGSAVIICPELPIQQLSRFAKIACFIVPGLHSYDSENPGIIYIAFTIAIFIENIGDAFGENAIVGGNRVVNTSQGAGFLDVEHILIQDIIEITTLVNKAIVLESSSQKQSVIKKNNPLLFRVLSFSALTGVY